MIRLLNQHTREEGRRRGEEAEKMRNPRHSLTGSVTSLTYFHLIVNALKSRRPSHTTDKPCLIFVPPTLLSPARSLTRKNLFFALLLLLLPSLPFIDSLILPGTAVTCKVRRRENLNARNDSCSCAGRSVLRANISQHVSSPSPPLVRETSILLRVLAERGGCFVLPFNARLN